MASPHLATRTLLPASPAAFIGRYIRRHPVGHAIILFSVVAAVFCAIGSQYAIKHLVDVLSAAGDGPVGGRAVWSAFAVLAGLVAADNMLWRVGGWTAAHSFVAVTGDLRRDLFAHVTGHAPSYFADRQPGTLAGRITAMANAVFTVESTFAWSVLPPCIAVLGSIAVLASINPFMALALSGASLLLALVIVRLADRGRALHHDYAARAASVDGELVDVIGAMPLVRAFGATMRERVRFGERVAEETGARRRSLRYLEKLRVFHAATTALLTAGMLAWGIVLRQSGAASTGDVVLVTTMGFTILHGTRDLAVALVDSVQHVARLSEALQTLLVPHDMSDAENARVLHEPRGAVTFEGVQFSYAGAATPGARSVLREFDLTIAPGERVGLVGRSGSGKSTALALLQRVRDPSAGRVLIDGEDVVGLTLDSVHAAISVVPQDVTLLHRSVRENIRYGRPDASEDEVLAAAEAAGCDFIDALPQGMDTVVGDRGTKLSGGQRQRLAIARAFLRDAPILLLDEATSALDSESEQAVQRALDRLMTGRTVIAVAHRLSTLRDFDRIVVMEQGRIVQDGAPALLERTEGPYRELLRRQAFQLTETLPAQPAAEVAGTLAA
jgi:ATP-binding cassette subfamily B protein